jgi:hypothetical protein
MLSKIGVFHFGQNHAFPIEELYCALKTKGKDVVRDSLIVLPEGFNIRSRHSSPTHPYDYNPSVLSTLRCLAKEWAVVFVAGLIVDVDKHVDPPYNVANLIDGLSQKLMCYKSEADSWSVECCGGRSPSHSVHELPCDRNNPMWYEGLLIATFICLDAQVLEDENDERYNALKGESERAKDAVKIICVPASALYRDYLGYASSWPDHFFVMADSGHSKRLSFIARVKETFKSVSGEENMIELFALPPRSDNEQREKL